MQQYGAIVCYFFVHAVCIWKLELCLFVRQAVDVPRGQPRVHDIKMHAVEGGVFAGMNAVRLQ